MKLKEDQKICGERHILQTFELDWVDPWSSIHSMADDQRYLAFRSDSEDVVLAIGHAFCVTSGSTDSLTQLGDALKTQAGEFFGSEAQRLGVIATISAHFDPKNSGSWTDFSPVELSIPEICFRRIEGRWSLWILCEMSRFEEVKSRAISLLEVRDFGKNSPEFTKLEEDGYARLVDDALKLLTSPHLKKIVLARRLVVESDKPFSVPKILKNLELKFPSCIVFAERPEGSRTSPAATFLGATPEYLVRVVDGEVFTEALAGSAPRALGKFDDELGRVLLKNDKERREHESVRDQIRAVLLRLCDDVHIDGPKLKKLSNVQHMQSVFSAKLKSDRVALDLVQALHPTPAVCGQPTRLAMENIARMEAFSRGRYSGLQGWFSPDGKNAEVAVAIRSGLIHSQRAELFAGAGIVHGSIPESEDRETRLKLQAMIEALA